MALSYKNLNDNQVRVCPWLKAASLILFMPFLLIPLGCKKSPTSPGTGQWSEVTGNAFSSGRYGLCGTVFNGSMWAIGGAAGNADGSVTYYYSDVYSSGNGSHWNKVNASAPFGGRFGSQLLAYNGQLWLIGGNNNGTLMNDVWSSSDGVSWTQVLAPNISGTATQFTPREDFCALVYNGSMWVIAGFSTGQSNNDVWTSNNGSTWTEVLADGSSNANHFGVRWGLSGVVYNNLMWIFNGASSTSANSDPTFAYADVWNSSTGNSWNLISNNQLSRVYYGQAITDNNQLFLTDGYLWNYWGPQDAVHISSDGINWNSYLASWPIRFGELSLSYNNSAWIIGGCDNVCTSMPCPTTVTYYNDVWRTP